MTSIGILVLVVIIETIVLLINSDKLQKERKATKEKIGKEWEDIKKTKEKLEKEANKIDRQKRQIAKEQEEIGKTRIDMEEAWKAIEATKRKSPAELIIMSVNQKFDDPKILVREITELRGTELGNVSTIKTEIDKSILSIEDEVKERVKVLKDEIINIESKLYPLAFMEYFRNIKDNAKRDREHEALRQKYHPNAYFPNQQRKNRNWAQQRTLELKEAYKKVTGEGS